MTDFLTVYAVFATREEAKKVAQEAVIRKLAACANILGPCQSIFHWNGAVEETEEVPALFKTSRQQANALISLIKELHSYEVPAITAWPIDKLLHSYGDWMQEILR